MELGSYDSPTFLTQKDKYVMGLSLPELMMAMGVGAVWFVIALMIPVNMLVRFAIVIPVTGVSLMILFVRISGLSIPKLILLSLLRAFCKPSYEESRDLLLRGQFAWLEVQRVREEGGSSSRFAFLKRGKRALDIPEARQAELEADLGRQVTEGAVAAEQWARDVVRSITRGH